MPSPKLTPVLEAPDPREAPGASEPSGPSMAHLPESALGDVATFFQALSEPTRLRLLNQLREGERKVGDLAERAGTTVANVSRHLSLLQQRGIVLREGRGTCVYYRIADPSIYQLCDLVCGQVARRHAALFEAHGAQRAALRGP